MDLFDLPFADLLWKAQAVHRARHDPNHVQRATLLSIKTGGCAENCGYCSQSAHHKTGLKAEKLVGVDAVVDAARAAKAAGAERFCMGAAWSRLKDRDLPAIEAMIAEVNNIGLETCMTLGMLTDMQALRLADAGLDYYNHNLDSSPEYYDQVVTTRSYEDRTQTIEAVRRAGIKVCCGGIVGMGESRADRAGLILQLATLAEHPASVPINMLVPVAGTPMGDALLQGVADRVDEIEFVRTVAVTRVAMPASVVRLSAGRESMSEAAHALCFIAGANSIFTGERLLTAPNSGGDADERLLSRLGIR